MALVRQVRISIRVETYAVKDRVPPKFRRTSQHAGPGGRDVYFEASLTRWLLVL